MSRPEADGPAAQPPLDVPRFDERAARLAVWRGIVRTALVAAAWLLAGLVLLQLVTALWQRGGDRDDRFELVVGQGLAVANPDYSVSPPGCCNTALTGIELLLEAVPGPRAQSPRRSSFDHGSASSVGSTPRRWPSYRRRRSPSRWTVADRPRRRPGCSSTACRPRS